MSRVYFTTPTRRAELYGSERAWLRRLAVAHAATAWDLGGAFGFERAREVLAWVPEPADRGFGEGYLHRMLRETQPRDYEAQHRLTRALHDALTGPGGLKLTVAGVELNSGDVALNTALAAGSDPVRLAAKITGWCEVHAYIEGGDRAWVAGIIEEGLASGLYRRGLMTRDHPDGEPRRQEQGWGDVLALLRDRDDEPVVLWYSVTDGFPNPDVAGFELPQDEDGDDDLAPWDALSGAERWGLATAGLRRERPWCRIAPGTLATCSFGPMVTVYDLFAPDRDERVRRTAGLPSGTAAAEPR